MSNEDSELSPAFIERQRERLETLRAQHLEASNQAETEKRAQNQRRLNEVQDSGDERAIQASRYAAEVFSAEGNRRLGQIRRALEKITDGSYGLSDDSGEPISRA